MRLFRVILLALVSIWSAAAAENKVLELDGNGSYVELPPDIFTNLTQATVEVWAKWESFRNFSRVFEFGAAWQSMSIFNQERFPDVRFNLYPRNAREDRSLMYNIRVNGLLRANEWIHLAAVSGPGGMKLYANGTLVGEHTNAASFADIKVSHTNVFGTGLARNPNDQDFRGQIDEIRVWNYCRTEAQIRQDMRKRLTGKEGGLVGCWNFDDGTARDSSPSGSHGKLMGQARVVGANLELEPPPLGSEPGRAAQPVPAAPSTRTMADLPGGGWNAVAWWIAGALTLIVVLLAWLGCLLRRGSYSGAKSLLPMPTQGRQPAGLTAGMPGAQPLDRDLKERALAELTEFAKESLVQGLYSQRKALLEIQQNALRQVAELEAQLGDLRLSERIRGYEHRIAELEKELENRSSEVRELTAATLLLLRRKLEEEKRLEAKSDRFN